MSPPAAAHAGAHHEHKHPVWHAIKPYVNGGVAGMSATCIIQPVDMVKVRLQLGAKGSPVSTIVVGQATQGQEHHGQGQGLLLWSVGKGHVPLGLGWGWRHHS